MLINFLPHLTDRLSRHTSDTCTYSSRLSVLHFSRKFLEISFVYALNQLSLSSLTAEMGRHFCILTGPGNRLLLVSLGLLLYFVTLGRAWLLYSLNEAALEAFLATLVDIAFVICQLQFIHLVR